MPTTNETLTEALTSWEGISLRRETINNAAVRPVMEMVTGTCSDRAVVMLHSLDHEDVEVARVMTREGGGPCGIALAVQGKDAVQALVLALEHASAQLRAQLTEGV